MLVRAPQVRLLHLGRLDERIAAHLDGVSVAGPYGTKLALRGLLFTDENGGFEGELATDVPSLQNNGISADGKTITYHLRPMTWHDGQQVTAADV